MGEGDNNEQRPCSGTKSWKGPHTLGKEDGGGGILRDPAWDGAYYWGEASLNAILTNAEKIGW